MKQHVAKWVRGHPGLVSSVWNEDINELLFRVSPEIITHALSLACGMNSNRNLIKCCLCISCPPQTQTLINKWAWLANINLAHANWCYN